MAAIVRKVSFIKQDSDIAFMAGGEVSGQKPEQVAGGKKKSNSMIAIVAVVIVIIIIGAVVGYEITKPPAKKPQCPPKSR